MPTFKVFGLTGGIACGKSTVAALFASLGVPIIDADTVAHEAQAPGTPGHEAVVKAFGEGILNERGAIDRRALGDIVFTSSEALSLLDTVLSPHILKAVEAKVRSFAETTALVGVESAILIEKGLFATYRPMVVVVTSPEEQLQRLMARNTLSEENARLRIATQMDIGQKAKFADFLIDTSCPKEELLPIVASVLPQIRSWSDWYLGSDLGFNRA